MNNVLLTYFVARPLTSVDARDPIWVGSENPANWVVSSSAAWHPRVTQAAMSSALVVSNGYGSITPMDTAVLTFGAVNGVRIEGFVSGKTVFIGPGGRPQVTITPATDWPVPTAGFHAPLNTPLRVSAPEQAVTWNGQWRVPTAYVGVAGGTTGWDGGAAWPIDPGTLTAVSPTGWTGPEWNDGTNWHMTDHAGGGPGPSFVISGGEPFWYSGQATPDGVPAGGGVGSVTVTSGVAPGGTTLSAPSAAASAFASTGSWVIGVPLSLSPPAAQAAAVDVVASWVPLTGVQGDPSRWPLNPLPATLLPGQAVSADVTYPLGSMTLEPGEPDTDGVDRSCWIRVMLDRESVLTAVTAPGGGLVRLYQGTSVDDVVGVATSADSGVLQSWALRAGTPYLLRVATALLDANATTTLTLTAVSAYAVVTCTPIVESPGASIVNGAGFTPGLQATVTVPGTAVSVAVSVDSSGSFSVQLDVPSLAPGSWTVVASTPVEAATASLQITRQSIADETPADDPVPAVTWPQPVGGVMKWVLKESQPGGMEYVFDINPDSMTSPYAPRQYTVDRTVAAQGVAFAWEGGFRAHEWQFSGTLLSQDQYDALVAFYNVGRRFWLRDHRTRIWTVTFADLDLVPLRKVGQPWAHRYTVKALIYACYLPEGWSA